MDQCLYRSLRCVGSIAGRLYRTCLQQADCVCQVATSKAHSELGVPAWQSVKVADVLGKNLVLLCTVAVSHCGRVGIPSWYVTSQLGQLSLAPLWGCLVEYRLCLE